MASALQDARPQRRIAELLLWMTGFAVAEYVFSLRPLIPTAPGAELRLISPSTALLAVALMLRPRREAVAYTLIYAIVGLIPEAGSSQLDFAVTRIAIEAGQTFLLVCITMHYFYHRFGEPLVLAAWTVAVLALTAFGALLTIVTALSLPMSSADYTRELAGSVWTAWRYWWLGNACTYLTLATPAAVLVILRHRLKRLILTPGHDRERFAALALLLLVASLIGFPVNDMSQLGLPPDVVVATHLLPMPLAMAMATRFRANGAAVATLIFSVIAIASVTGPNAAANWRGPVSPITPTHAILLVTTTTSIVLAGISRQLKLALNEALEASQAKSRFIAMLNHELRTPLNAILGFSELMRLQNVRAMGDALGPIENIHASGQRLLAMIEGLLSQADRGASAFDLTKQPLCVAQAVAAAASDVASEIEQFRCRMRVSANDDLVIDADPRALKQMLLVLLGYPLRFVGPQTLISVSAAHHGTDTVIEVGSDGLINAAADDRDKLELQLVNALALAHGARLHVEQSGRTGRIARLTFFATRAAA